MMGLMVLGIFAVYLAVSVWVVTAASGWAKANNKKPWLWVKENLGVETLDSLKYLETAKHTGEKGNSSWTYQLNSGLIRKSTEFSISSWLPLYKQEETIAETDTNTILIRYVDFWAGYFDENSISNLKWTENRGQTTINFNIITINHNLSSSLLQILKP